MTQGDCISNEPAICDPGLPLAPDALRQVAVLLASLDTETAKQLLSQLPAEQAKPLCRAVETLGDISDLEKEQALAAFGQQLVGDSRASNAAAADETGCILELGSDRQGSWRGEASQLPPFDYLHRADVETLVAAIRNERPQTIALVVAHLNDERAIEVVRRLPSDLQVEVMRRWVSLDEPDPEVLRELDQSLRSRIEVRGAQACRDPAGLQRVTQILAAADSLARHQILATLHAHDESLAAKLGRRPLRFEELSHLSDESLAAIVARADPELVLLALAGAPQALADRMLSRLPSPQGRRMRESLSRLGPTRLSDVEAAQADLAQLAETLVAQSEIELASGRYVAAVA